MRTLRVGFSEMSVRNVFGDVGEDIRQYQDVELVRFAACCLVRTRFIRNVLKNQEADYRPLDRFLPLNRSLWYAGQPTEPWRVQVGYIDHDYNTGLAFNLPLVFHHDRDATDFILRYGNDYRILDDDLNVITEGPAK